MSKAQHPTSGIAKHTTSHQIPHHTVPHHAMWCVIWWYWTEYVKLMWYGVKYCWAVVVRCGVYNTSHLVTHDSTTFYIAFHTDQTRSLTYHTFHTTPAPLAAHYCSSQYHISNRTVSATLCITPHLTLHPISHYVPHNATFHVHHTTFQIIYRPHYASHHVSRTTPCFSTQHCRIGTWRSTSCIIASFRHVGPWWRPIPHPTAMFHITFHITHQYTTTFYIIPLITSRITPPPLPLSYCAGSQPTHCLIPHHTTFHIPCHSTHTHTNPYYTTTFHNPIPVWETIIMCSVLHWEGHWEEALLVSKGRFQRLVSKEERGPENES